ncbi:MAG: NAD(P)H-dependent oxidoreductase [Oceanospirillaceae bacterium]|nr:NAD(P)H-dependent oxidoreductase [Oceanospirillaceae bacterium]
MKKVLVINANPKSNSFCKSLADQYCASLPGHYVSKIIHLGLLDFDSNLQEGYDQIQPLEPDLVDFQESVKWAEHIVIISPVWWGGLPAKFKGIIDRTFLPGFAFKYINDKSTPKQLLEGRTSELIITLDTPVFWYKYANGNPIYKELKRCMLGFSGIKNTSATYFAPIISSTREQREKWLNQVSKIAKKLK